MSEIANRRLRIFLCHADEDKPKVRELYEHLIRDGYDAWFDQEKIMSGADWRRSIKKGLREADIVIVCLSNVSVQKEGYVQHEIKDAIEFAKEKPGGTIYLVPIRLDTCEVPDEFLDLQWTNLFDTDGYKRVRQALEARIIDLKKKGFGDVVTKNNISSFMQWLTIDSKFKPKFTQHEEEKRLKTALIIWYVISLGTAFIIFLLEMVRQVGASCTFAFLLIFVQWAIINRYTNRGWVWFAVNLLLISTIYLLPFFGIGSYININPNSVPPVIINPVQMRISVALWTIWAILNAIVAPYIMGQVGKFLITQR